MADPDKRIPSTLLNAEDPPSLAKSAQLP